MLSPAVIAIEVVVATVNMVVWLASAIAAALSAAVRRVLAPLTPDNASSLAVGTSRPHEMSVVNA